MMKFFKPVLLLALLFSASCGNLPAVSSFYGQGSSARLLVYLHTTAPKPQDIEFSISWIALETMDGSLVNVMQVPVQLGAVALVGRQVRIAESLVEGGDYKGIRMGISKASIKSGPKRASLALPQPGGEVSFPLDIKLEAGESLVVTFEWDPNRSVAKRVVFDPAINVSAQEPSAKVLHLFVSNSASNYISVIDTSLERVVGAVTVGEGPMGMALNTVQDSLYVVNSVEGTISIVQTAQFFVADTIRLAVGLGPTDVVFMPDSVGSIEGKLYVVNTVSNDVSVVSTATKRVLTVISVGENPSAIAVDIDRKEVYVTNKRLNNVTVINTVDDTVVGTIIVDNKPVGITIGEDRLYVFNEGSSTISIVSPSTRSVVETVSLIEPPKTGIKASGERLFVANTSTDRVTFIDPNNIITRVVPSGPSPRWFAWDEERDRIYVTNHGDRTVTVLDPVGERVVNVITVGGKPYAAVLMHR